MVRFVLWFNDIIYGTIVLIVRDFMVWLILIVCLMVRFVLLVWFNGIIYDTIILVVHVNGMSLWYDSF